ncbi:hypothetical protein J7889_03635 [Mycoplasmopsis agalactiae]|nr:transglutaminase domain-containing protein [Mycoplasmopsis agalactiae]MCE6056661.1 hypothetical protein [Mycoplasmopsis agalactiae]
MKKFKKHTFNLLITCSLSSVFASASCLGNNNSSDNAVINGSKLVIINESPAHPVSDDKNISSSNESSNASTSNNHSSSSDKVVNSSNKSSEVVNTNKNSLPNTDVVNNKTIVHTKNNDNILPNNTAINEVNSPSKPQSVGNNYHLAPEVINISNIQNIANVESSLPELDKFYLKKTIDNFVEQSLSDEQIKSMILNYGTPSNFYSHPKYAINKPYVSLDSNGEKTEKLSLIDTQTNQEIKNEVQWFLKDSYADKVVAKANEEVGKSKLFLSADGTIKGKKHNNDYGIVQVWAYYKGYIYSSIVDVASDDNSKNIKENQLSMEKAKEVAKKWNDLPNLEKVIEAYKWVTKNIKYDFSRDNLNENQNPYSALIKMSTVCTGYAKAFMMLMNELGIPCRLVTGHADYGTLTGSGGSATRHAWNMVEIDGEWYHVDTTSDRADDWTDKDGKFNFFMMHNDDFIKASKFDKGNFKMGNRLRNLMIENYVNSEEDAQVAIDKQLGGLDKLPRSIKLNVAPESYKNVTKALETAKLDLDETRGFSKSTLPWVSYDTITYLFKEPGKNIELENVTVNVSSYSVTDKILGKYALKVKFNGADKIDLKAGNFIVKNAYVKEAIKENEGYVLILDNFNKFGDVDIELESIKKLGYKFDVRNNKHRFNVIKHSKPNAIVKAVGEKRIQLFGVNAGMEYRNSLNEWQDINHDEQVIDNVAPDKFSIRYKDSNDKVQSDIQIFNLTKGRDLDNIVKLYNNNTLVGIDNTMEYRVKDSNDWIKITETKLVLSPGEYIIRVAPNNTQLASQSYKVIVQ